MPSTGCYGIIQQPQEVLIFVQLCAADLPVSCDHLQNLSLIFHNVHHSLETLEVLLFRDRGLEINKPELLEKHL